MNECYIVILISFFIPVRHNRPRFEGVTLWTRVAIREGGSTMINAQINRGESDKIVQAQKSKPNRQGDRAFRKFLYLVNTIVVV